MSGLFGCGQGSQFGQYVSVEEYMKSQAYEAARRRAAMGLPGELHYNKSDDVVSKKTEPSNTLLLLED